MNFVGLFGCLLAFRLCRAKGSYSELFLAIVAQLLHLWVKILLDAKLIAETTYFLLHLIGHTHWHKVALVFFRIIHANIVVTSLLLCSAVMVLAACFIFDIFVLALQNSLFDCLLDVACLALVLLVKVKFHLFQLGIVWHVLWKAD